MEVAPDLQSVTPIARYREDNLADLDEIDEYTHVARSFLSGFGWQKEITDVYVGAVFPGIIGIFLSRIEPARAGVDDWTWVIVGDVPPAYITCEDAVVPWEALDGYIGALEPWVAAVRAGTSVSNLMPVNVAPTSENADALERRLKFLDSKIMPLLGGPEPTST